MDIKERRKKPLVVEDVMFRITQGPASYFHKGVIINNCVVHIAPTLQEARDLADAINRALAG